MLLEKVKKSLRKSGDHLDDEIIDLIDAAKCDLKLSGVHESKIVDSDPLIIRAITTYCKANFGYDNNEADRFQKSYDMLKMHMTMSIDYTEGVSE